MIFFCIDRRGIIVPTTVPGNCYELDTGGTMSEDLVRSSMAMYTFVTDEFKRLQGFISQLDSRLLRLEQAEALRRESGWRLYMPTDLSD